MTTGDLWKCSECELVLPVHMRGPEVCCHNCGTNFPVPVEKVCADACIKGFTDSFTDVAGRPPTQDELNNFADRLNNSVKDSMTGEEYDKRFTRLEAMQHHAGEELAELRLMANKVEKVFLENKEGYEKSAAWLWTFIDILSDGHSRRGSVFARAQEALGPCKTAQVRGRSFELLYEILFGSVLGPPATDIERDLVINRVSVLLERNSTMRLTLKHIAKSQHLDACTDKQCHCHAGVARTVLERYRYMDGMASKHHSTLKDLESEVALLKAEKEQYYSIVGHYAPVMQELALRSHEKTCETVTGEDCNCPCDVAQRAIRTKPGNRTRRAQKVTETKQ